jgi:O-antigen/teichoic acid export membrane protein
MLPVMLFAPGCHALQPSVAQGVRGEFMRLVANLGVALAAASTWVALLLLAAPWLLPLFGPPYSELGTLFSILLCMQWINGAGRPAIRFLSAAWDPKRIRNALCISAGVAILISVLATRQYGAYAAALATLAGALLINGQAIFAALRTSRARASRIPAEV